MNNSIKTAIDILSKEMDKNENRYKHSMSVAKLTKNLLRSDNDFAVQCIFSAVLHDIGYSKSAQYTGFHPVDGYLYLKNYEIEHNILMVTLHHSLAILDCKMNHHENLSLIYKDKGNNLNKETKKMIEVVSYADWHTNSKGELVSVDDRYKEILERHGEDSKVWDFMLKVRPQIDLICKNVENNLIGFDYTVGQIEL